MNNFDNSLGNEAILGENILATNLGEENTNIGIITNNGTFNDPFSNELEFISIIENEVQSGEKNNNTQSNDFSAIDPGIDPLTGNNVDDSNQSKKEAEIASLDLNDASFAPPKSELQFAGGFGDFEGGNDVTLEVKDDEDNIIETFALVGEGQGEVYRDEDGTYLFFSGTDETTEVDISAIGNVTFGDFFGGSLEIETTGSIEGGDVVLDDEDNTDESALLLKSGLESGVITGYEFNGYDLVDFGDVEVVDINYYGNVVGNLIDDEKEKAFFYNGAGLFTLNAFDSSEFYAINDRGDIVGEASTQEVSTQPFIIPNGGAITPLEFTAGENYRAIGYIRDINNYGNVASYIFNIAQVPSAPDLINAYYLSSEQSVNIGDLLNSEDTRAFGINDLGQVVGSNKDSKIAFLYSDGVATSLGALPGHSVSQAYEINNQGQIVGVSYNGQGAERAFFYSDGIMQDIGVDYSGNLYERSGIDINNLGQVVVTSKENEPFVYQDGTLTNINDLINPEFVSDDITLTKAQGINDRGQIIAQGEFLGENHGYLLNPTFLPIDGSSINIGNISTYGDSVLLDGGKITLSGETVKTRGGSQTFDGVTTVDSSNNFLRLNSSAFDDGTVGGDITFSGTLDGVDADSQNITIKAGKGNLLFEQAVGSENPFLDFIVEGADKVTANEDITVSGNLDLEVIDDISTANITADGLTTIALGKVGEEVFDSTGNVTIGNITTQGLNILNNGSLSAGEIATTDGDIDIISLDDLTVNQLTAINGAITLISGTGQINVNNSIQGDNGFVALAQLDISTNEIQSSQDSVILKSSKGAVTVNGSVTANDDVSLAGVNNVAVGAVTSKDGAVSLVSITGIITPQGTISGSEDITIGSAQNLLVETEVNSQQGKVSLVSTEGSVTVTSNIDNVLSFEASAKQNVTTKKIETNGGSVILYSEQGSVIAGGRIKSKGGNVYISSLKTVKSWAIISKGGDISVVSEQGAVRTGYLRSNNYQGFGGQIYLQAAWRIKVISSVNIDNTDDGIDNSVDYSIYTGGQEEGLVFVAHELNKKVSKRNEFVIGDFSLSGTKAEIYGEYAFEGDKPRSPIPSIPIIEFIIELFQSPPQLEPPNANDINPITGETYADDAERELTEQLATNQRNRLRNLINKKTDREEILKKEEFRKGKIDDNGCFTTELDGHKGDTPEYPNHGLYATYITGSTGDYLVVANNIYANYAFYDGLVKSNGAVTDPNKTKGQFLEPEGSVAEVKTQHLWLEKYLLNSNPYKNKKFKNDYERNSFRRLTQQIDIYSLVAELCGLKFFMSFDNLPAGRAGREIFEYFNPKKTKSPVTVHFLPPSKGLYP